MDFEWERKDLKADSPWIPKNNTPNFLNSSTRHQPYKQQESILNSRTGHSVFKTPSTPSSQTEKQNRQYFSTAASAASAAPAAAAAAAANSSNLHTGPAFAPSGSFSPMNNLSNTDNSKHSRASDMPDGDVSMTSPETFKQIPQQRPTSSGRMDPLMTPTERLTGRGEVRRGKFSDQRIHKRKPRSLYEREKSYANAHRGGRRDGYDDNDTVESDSDASANSTPAPRSRMRAKKTSPKWDQHFPHVASLYLQLFVNAFLVSIVLYVAYGFITTVKGDVDMKVKKIISLTIHEMAECSQKFVENRCAPGTRVPALEMRCLEWERCMSQDPEEVGRAKVSAHTFAEIVNSLIEPLSYKAMVSKHLPTHEPPKY